MPKTLLERFNEGYIPEPMSGCWIWERTHNRGYGIIRNDWKQYLAHRVSFELFNRKLEDGECVRHTCDNTFCVNPAHLVAGSQSDNMEDAIQRNRFAKGEAHYNIKLTDKDIEDIKAKAKNKMPQFYIAHLYGINQSTVSRIISGRKGADYRA